MQTLPQSQGGATAALAEFEHKDQVRGVLRAFLALRHRNFRLFWTGQLISLIGTWMQTTGQAWLVLELTHSAWLLGVVGALQFLPVMFLSLFGGVLADRLPTRQAFVVEMVGRHDLPNAIALNSSLFNLARILGPGLGGLIIAWVGVTPLFLMNAISFIPVITGLALIRMSELHAQAKPPTLQADAPRQNTLQSLREGLAYVWHTPSVLLIIAVLGTISLFGINFNVVLPLFATDVLHAGPVGFGFLLSAFGAGLLLSALWLAWGNTRPNMHRLLIAAFAFCLLEAAFAISH